jgi:hypothetical protein
MNKYLNSLPILDKGEKYILGSGTVFQASSQNKTVSPLSVRHSDMRNVTQQRLLTRVKERLRRLSN